MLDPRLLEREWSEIRSTGRGDGELEVPSRPSGVTSGYGQVRIAIGPKGQPRLLVPVARPAAAGAQNTGSNNLVVSRSSFRSGGKLEHFIDVMLGNPQLAKVFSELVREILARLTSGDGPETAVNGTIKDFRDLFARTPDAEVSLAKLGGLIGELVVLDMLTALRPEAISGWTGPLGQRHDFRRRDIAVEVKTSLRSDATRVTVHGPEQLMPQLSGRLFLAHVRVEPVDNGPLSLGALHRSIVARGADELMLDNCLAELGCRDANAGEWNTSHFALEGVDFYEVADGFPCVTPKSFAGGALPSGVHALTYEIDLSVARKCLLSHSQTADVLSEFAA
ncbi:PD-(D/E)XK motif protein [Devosia sp.]|uniref:PD-(D/E)XK motif protein n=1 Tax=Devosia sp. TaxID=1871048 RepID=UPI0025FCCE3D|nr:PD-(D/E)XK motif protein [Devosia sp.]MCR6634901.1 PD-(D/E)XK motif protein [Devosia sp.]